MVETATKGAVAPPDVVEATDEPAVDSTPMAENEPDVDPTAAYEVEPSLDPLTEAQVEAAAAGEPEAAADPEAPPAITDAEAPETLEAAEEPEAEPTAAAEPDAPEAAAESDAPEAATEPEVPDEAAEPEAPEAAPTDEPATPDEAAAAESDPTADADAPDTAAPGPVTSAPRTVGRFIADALRAAGVRSAFTVPGESFLGLLDGLGEAGIRIVTTRHEGGAAFMAEAHGQLTGRPAACLATRAVGAANLAIGIHTAHQDSTPMFALVGQVDRSVRGREAFQEVDQVGTFGRLAKWAAEPATAAEIPAAIGEAVRQALGGRPGPVLVSLAEDLLDETLSDAPDVDVSRPTAPRADIPETRAVLQLLASARHPVIVAGGGVLRARTSSDLTRFAELLDVPVIAAWRRADVMSNDHPLYLGMAGYGSPTVVRERLERADAMLVIGCRLNEITTFGYRIPSDETRWAHVDVAPRVAANGLRAPDIAIGSDARAFLRAAVQRLRGSVVLAEPVEARRAANESDRQAWEAASVVDAGDWTGPGVHPGRTIATLRRVLPDDGIVTTDAGNFGGWAARGFRFRRPGTFLGPTSGAMGYGVPAAIAAALVHRDRAVVALVGDGGLAMSMAELETAVRERARIVVVVFDNERYGTIRMHQDRRDAEPVGTDLGSIDFAAVARACGARGVRVDSDDAFEPALRQALAADRPTVLHLPLDRRWVSVDEPAVR